ncbi:MAG: hypothetical protein POG24_08140 [Acidocella sp.]|nr:hypothetical protein [Acidocella sp.]
MSKPNGASFEAAFRMGRMPRWHVGWVIPGQVLVALLSGLPPHARADGAIFAVTHVIVVMQENH